MEQKYNDVFYHTTKEKCLSNKYLDTNPFDKVVAFLRDCPVRV